MRRPTIVLSATTAGLIGVLSYHTAATGGSNLLTTPVGPGSTSPTSGTGAGASPTAGSASSSSTSSSTTTTPPPSSTTTRPVSGGQSTSGTSTVPTTTVSPSTTQPSVQHVDGATEQYRYGVLQLQVTISGGRITDVQPVVDQATDPRSASINSYAMPQLRQQALNAQSAQIDGVSGATYTSAAYEASLQSALDSAGFH